MRLLIVTQAIDRSDPVLGFFHRWVEEFAKSTEHISVICLKKGRFELPQNVSVHSLGKEVAPSRIRYVLNFYRYLWMLRGSYDVVLVHMNDEYVLLGGWWWKCAGVKIGLWRNHVQGSWKAAVACRLADVLFYTSPQTYASRFAHAHKMPVGIDTEFFTPPHARPPSGTVLSLGRIDPVKKIDVLLEALQLLKAPYHIDIVGSATPGREHYEQELTQKCSALVQSGVVTFHPGVHFTDTPSLYRSHRIFINLTPTGSFDKTMLEAAACGCLLVVSNPALKEVVSPLCYVAEATPERVAAALERALVLDDYAFTQETATLRAYVAAEHSLSLLCRNVLNHLEHA